MALGLGTSLTKSGLATPGIVTDSLVLKHNYAGGAVVPVSDGAALFNGTSDYIAIGAKPVDTADATYCFWANSSVSGAANRAIFGHGASAQGEFSLAYNSDGEALLYLHLDLFQYWDDGAGNSYVSDGQWHHIAIVVDIDSMPDCKLYVDGVEIPQGGRATSATATAYGNLEIGRINSSKEYEGYLCNFGVWSGHLTQPQIKSIMNKNYAGLTSTETTNLVSWWNLDERITEDYDAESTSDADPSTISDLVFDNHDVTLTEVSVSNSDFTSGSGTTITGWTNESSQWTRVGDTVVSGTTAKLLSQDVLTNNIAHKIIVRAKNTTAGSTGILQVYCGANNHANYNLTDDFEDYVFHGLQANDLTLFIYNASSTNITVDNVEVYKYDGNVGVLL